MSVCLYTLALGREACCSWWIPASLWCVGHQTVCIHQNSMHVWHFLEVLRGIRLSIICNGIVLLLWELIPFASLDVMANSSKKINYVQPMYQVRWDCCFQLDVISLAKKWKLFILQLVISSTHSWVTLIDSRVSGFLLTKRKEVPWLKCPNILLARMLDYSNWSNLFLYSSGSCLCVEIVSFF